MQDISYSTIQTLLRSRGEMNTKMITAFSNLEKKEVVADHCFFPRLKGGSYKINDCLFVCLFVCVFVTGSKEHYRQGY